jgi:hypothetical protein
MQLATPIGMGKTDKKYVGKLDNMHFIKVILPPLDKYIFFHPAKRRSNSSITPSQITLALKEIPKRRMRYFIGKEDTVQPRILAKPSTLLTLPTGTNFDLLRLIFKLETTSKHKNKAHRKRGCFWVCLAKKQGIILK